MSNATLNKVRSEALELPHSDRAALARDLLPVWMDHRTEMSIKLGARKLSDALMKSNQGELTRLTLRNRFVEFASDLQQRNNAHR